MAPIVAIAPRQVVDLTRALPGTSQIGRRFVQQALQQADIQGSWVRHQEWSVMVAASIGKEKLRYAPRPHSGARHRSCLHLPFYAKRPRCHGQISQLRPGEREVAMVVIHRYR